MVRAGAKIKQFLWGADPLRNLANGGRSGDRNLSKSLNFVRFSGTERHPAPQLTIGTARPERARSDPANQRERGSSASRKPSPRRLKESTARKIASPGQTAIQGAVTRKRWAALSMLPHEGAGGC